MELQVTYVTALNKVVQRRCFDVLQYSRAGCRTHTRAPNPSIFICADRENKALRAVVGSGGSDWASPAVLLT